MHYYFVLSFTNVSALIESIVQDVSGQILDAFRKRPKVTLPKADCLKELIDMELPENMKIPLTQREFNTLISNDINDLCGPDDLRVLFRVSETESALHFCDFRLVGTISSRKIQI